MLSYLDERKKRGIKFRLDLENRSVRFINQLPEDEQKSMRQKHFGNERMLLRKRRTRLRITHFDIMKQIGQGGYGEVFLARKKDTEELCALKKMNKQLLQKLGEVLFNN